LPAKHRYPNSSIWRQPARVFVTNDSGAMHIASALGVNQTVAVFGATDDSTTGPPGSTPALCASTPECSPCLLRECPIDHRCMTRVSVDRVTQVAIAIGARDRKGAVVNTQIKIVDAAACSGNGPVIVVTGYFDRCWRGMHANWKASASAPAPLRWLCCARGRVASAARARRFGGCVTHDRLRFSRR